MTVIIENIIPNRQRILYCRHYYTLNNKPQSGRIYGIRFATLTPWDPFFAIVGSEVRGELGMLGKSATTGSLAQLLWLSDRPPPGG